MLQILFERLSMVYVVKQNELRPGVHPTRVCGAEDTSRVCTGRLGTIQDGAELPAHLAETILHVDRIAK
jgi:hypothetical protein